MDLRTLCLGALAGASLLTGCTPRRTFAPLRLDTSVADSVVTTSVAPGARLHRVVNMQAPWRAYVLEVDLTCTALHAMKGGATAVGRTTTSGLLASLPANSGAIAMLNADFFAFTPVGVPTNLHVERGVLLAGPGGKPLLTVRNGRVAIDSITAAGRITRGTDTIAITTWNRPSARQVGIVDARWGVALDTVVRRRAWRLDPLPANPARVGEAPAGLAGRYVARALRDGDTLVLGDTLLLHLPAPARGRGRVATINAGDTVRVALGLARRGQPVAITEAVGGRPIVLADSSITADVNTEGNEGFRNLNPRSAVGLDRTGRRAWLAVIDGRRPGYSMGMTLRQVGSLMQALGATQALNLDGGGSSALAIRDKATTIGRVVNRPSDPVERSVGNALAVFSSCRSR
jgi:hypothetical protein